MEDNKGFSTNDRRGSVSDEADAHTSDSVATGQDEEVKVGDDSRPGEGDIKIDFSTFILSMSSSVFLHFGEIPNPETGEKKENLLAAKQTIDIISMLQEKTQGNLTDDERKLLENILYELRMKYMDLVNG